MKKKARNGVRPKTRPKTALAIRQQLAAELPVAEGMLGVFQRMARDPDLTVGALGELIRMSERQEERQAQKEFDTAYRTMQPEIPRISKRGIIKNKGGNEQSRYSKYEDIRKVVDPIMRRYGFTFHPHTEWPSTGVLEVVGVLEHEGGGKRESRFRTTADESGGKNAIQGLGSGVSYGKRYTLIDLLAIVCEGQDDDGKAHGEAQQKRQAPAGVVDVQPVERAAGWDKGRGEPITDGQLRRLLVIAGNSRPGEEAKIAAWLLQRFGWTSSRQITRDKYDAVCRALEAPGVLLP